MEKSSKIRAGTNSINSMDENNKKNDDNAPQQEELTRAALEELMQTESKLRDAINTKQESKHQWRIREKGLRCSNWKLELENTKIREQTNRQDREILTEVEKNERYHDEVIKCKSQKQQDAADFWNYFQQETKRYSQLLPNAHIEYNSDCLNQDIEMYREKCRIISDRITMTEKYMDSLKRIYGLAELGTNNEARLLEDFNAAKKIISDKTVLMRATRSAEDINNVLKLTIKQKKQAIAYLKLTIKQKNRCISQE